MSDENLRSELPMTLTNNSYFQAQDPVPLLKYDGILVVMTE